MKKKEVALTDAEYSKLLRIAKKEWNGRGEDVAQLALLKALARFNPKRGSLYNYASACLSSANADLLKKYEGYSYSEKDGYVLEEIPESRLMHEGWDDHYLDLAESAPHYDRIIRKRRGQHAY